MTGKEVLDHMQHSLMSEMTEATSRIYEKQALVDSVMDAVYVILAAGGKICTSRKSLARYFDTHKNIFDFASQGDDGGNSHFVMAGPTQFMESNMGDMTVSEYSLPLAVLVNSKNGIDLITILDCMGKRLDLVAQSDYIPA